MPPQKNFFMSEDKPFRILSIDGGGIRGVLPCSFLAELENELIRKHGEQARLCDYFDLIAGTSTGGIIAIGLALRVRAQRLLELYECNGEKIFPQKNQRIKSKAKRAFNGKPFYERNELKILLKETYEKEIENARIGHAKTRLLVPTFNLEHNKIHVLKTSHTPFLERDYQIPAVDAALSTAAAPIYFIPYDFTYRYSNKEGEETLKHLVDGGIVANNPTFMAILEAHNALKVPLENIKVLSIGTGQSNYQIPKLSERINPFFWIDPRKGFMLYEVMSQAQSIHTDNLISLFKNNVGKTRGDRFYYKRLQHVFPATEKIDLDSTSTDNIDKIKSIGKQWYRENGYGIESLFLNKIKEEFKPFHTL